LELIDLAKNSDPDQIVSMLNRIVPGATVSSTPSPDLISVL